jgi:hypothetical protein
VGSVSAACPSSAVGKNGSDLRTVLRPPVSFPMEAMMSAS